MTRFQYPNPLDLMFFAADGAARRLGMSNVNIQIVLELRGEVDIARFRRAAGAIQRVYPAAGGRVEVDLLRGHPRWRLNRGAADPAGVVRVWEVKPASEAGLQRVIERIYAKPIDARRLPAVRYHVLRGLRRGDVVLVRFAHALMDARGGTLFLEEFDQLYQDDPAPDTLVSVGDEQRDDYARLLNGAKTMQRVRMAMAAMSGREVDSRPVVQLPRRAICAGGAGRLRFDPRKLSAEETTRVRDNAMRVCGFGRFGDYLRACAIRALHREIGDQCRRGALYTTLNLVNNRKRRERRPVCRNLTSGLGLAVPAGLANDLRRVADLLRDQTLAHMSSDAGRRQFAVLSVLMRTPTAIAGELIRAGWTRGGDGPRSLFVRPPSMPLGLMGPFTRPMEEFCGAPLENYYGFATVRPQSGFTIDVNVTKERINTCGAHYDGLVETQRLRRLLDGLVEGLLDPDD